MRLSQGQISKNDDRLTRWCLFLGIIIWFIDLNTVYALPSLSCEWGWFTSTVLGIPSLVLIETLVTLFAMLAISFMIYIPWRNWRKSQSERRIDDPQILNDTEADRRSFLAFVTMLMNCFLFLFLIATVVPMLTLNVCARG